MKTRKGNKRDQQITMQNEMEDNISHRKKRNKKVKYKHKSHWLAIEDDDYEFPNYKDEEE